MGRWVRDRGQEGRYGSETTAKEGSANRKKKTNNKC